jgi:hypothetical protein
MAIPRAELKPAMEKVVSELLAVLPEEWDKAELKLVGKRYPDGTEGLAHTIGGPEGRPEFPEPSEALYEATRELQLLARRHGEEWKQARIAVELRDDGWDYSFNFEH